MIMCPVPLVQTLYRGIGPLMQGQPLLERTTRANQS